MQKKAQTVSIVIPVFNEENHLKTCLESIQKQTVKPFAVIVVDNNCTDRSMDIARQFPFVTIVKEGTQGIVHSRNAGFNKVSSSIIGRIDSDTRLPANWVERVEGFYEDKNHKNHALTGGCAFYNVRSPRVDEWITSQFVFRMNRMIVGHYILWGSNMAFPTSAWKEVKSKTCTRQDIHEDLDLAIHLHRAGYKITYAATLIVGAKMKRVFSNQKDLWRVLKMWPQTLKVHHIRRWPLGYIGAVFLYVSQFVPRIAERIAIAFGKKPLSQ